MPEPTTQPRLKIVMRRLLAAGIDALLLSAISTIIFYMLCGSILAERQEQHYTLTMSLLPKTVLTAASMTSIWGAFAFWDALATFPTVMAYFLSTTVASTAASIGLLQQTLAATFLANFAYSVGFELSPWHCTPGKFACKLLVRSNGETQPHFVQIANRHMAKSVASSILITALPIALFLRILEKVGLKLPFAPVIYRVAGLDQAFGLWPHDLLSDTTVSNR